MFKLLNGLNIDNPLWGVHWGHTYTTLSSKPEILVFTSLAMELWENHVFPKMSYTSHVKVLLKDSIRKRISN